MTRVEENEELQKWFLGQSEKRFVTYESATTSNLGVIASILMDISKSLAIIADKEKQDEEIDS